MTRVEAFATAFESANNALIALVEQCSEEQWQQRCVGGEERAVGAVAYHVAATYPAFAHIVRVFVAGETFSPRSSMEEVHQSNAQEAQENDAVGQAATVRALQEEGGAIAGHLRALQDEQLDRVAGVFGGNELRVAQVVEWVVIGHTNEHLATLRTTLAS